MNPFRFASVALALVMWSVSGQAQNGCKPTDPAGSFAGTAISQQAGKLDVTLNLHCDNGRYAGGAVSSVGTYTVQDGHFDANQLYLTLESSGDTVTIEAAFDAGILHGKFTAAGDTGPIELHLPGPQAAETKPAIEHVTADTPRVTSAGATFKVPSGWSIETRNDLAILTPPETDTHVCIFDSQAADAKAAVAEAWAAYKPESKRPIKLVTPRPAREGWEERQVFDYETSPNERAAVQALALRAGNRWTVVILEGTDPTVEKRSAPIGWSLKASDPRTTSASRLRAVRRTRWMPHTSINSNRSWKPPCSNSASPASRSLSLTAARSSTRAGSACANSASRRRSTKIPCSWRRPTPKE
ncbi:MAG: hypothetical protein WCA27_17735 [Candidatus Sulfotelmatobacter sp.]